MSDIQAIAAGYNYSLALTKSGDVYSFGYGGVGQLGHDNRENQHTPKKIEGLSNVQAIAAGMYHSLALTKSGDVYSFGLNNYGQLGHDDTNELLTPKKIEGLSNVQAIVAGTYHSLALTKSGDVYSFGLNNYDQLGHGDKKNQHTPKKIEDLSDIQAIAAGHNHSLALTKSGDVYSFGYGGVGQLGHDNRENQHTPKKIEGLSNVQAIVAGTNHSLALTKSGDVYSFGDGWYGQLGHDNRENQHTPKKIEGLSNIQAIAAGYNHSLVLAVEEDSTPVPPTDQVAKPVADPSGGEVPSGTKITLSTTTEDATIYYTTDGSEPSSSSSAEYIAPIEVTEEMTIKAIAVKEGMLNSDVLEERYTILEQVAKPVADPSGGEVPSGTKITLSTTTEDATIYYTTDGSEPSSSSSAEYIAPIEVTKEMTIKAIAVKEGMQDSKVLEAKYTIRLPDQVAKPVADPSGGEVPSGTKITLSTTTEDATIYYTTDGSTPSSSSAKYNDPIEVTEEMTLKAIAVKDGMQNSDVMEEHYTIATIPAPANLTASAADRSVTLQWDAVTGTVSVTYAVYQAEGTSAPVDPKNWKLLQSNVTANSYIVTGLTNGTTYAFAVKAVSEEGVSDFSNVVTATPSAPSAPGGNSGSGGGGGGHALSGNARLADLQVWAEGKSLKLSPSFASGTTAYTAHTEAERIEIVVKEAHSAAKVIWKDKVITDRIQVDLMEGDNTIELTVQAENGTKKTYTLTIYREQPKPTEPVIDITDIAGHWAESYIKRAAAKGIVSGYPDGTFKPDHPVTRAEFTVMLAGALKLEGQGAALTFTDHEQIGEWARQAVAQAVQAGIVDGYNDGSFRPNAQITRVEMAAMIARALQLQLNANASTGFADDEAIPQWAKGAVEAIRKLGIVDGRGGNRFVPNETATRAEATVILLRLLDR
ncbi:chitobiase/beta-hexosaminidase C-terminal domain-containing protein [Paenibacillus sp. MSJ-34]|uniref:RCC1 domain-containing protein n=1 Tax=Paenibacillus sp. MSJ-34 TaxID=2841529 RepID=UPI001C106D13|nr:chitobiase/beta-hexosaminidase C-terminal domain-containing protein [Paenibacillus sp. MSJ-34]MBU5443345.1 chitobiase/beta-hexosaminidase C-terminal domain-containing protein [Paenibacillus sp. MSJ-34]